MTITLSWWALPAALVLAGFVYAVYDEATSSGWLGGLNGALVFVAAFVAALGIVVGHFL